MSETIITTTLVGAHFRPPAKALLACLPTGHPLILRPEPANEYDRNAVQVLLRTDTLVALGDPLDDFIKNELETNLADYGFDLQTIYEADEWQLGYLPRAAKGNQALETWNIEVQQAIHAVCGREHADDMPVEGAIVPASLSFDSAGKPTVLIPWPPKAE